MSEIMLKIYSPDPELARPLKVLKSMWLDLQRARPIAWRLFVRDFSAQYRASFLGYAWAVLPPLLNSFTFVFLNNQGLLKAGNTGCPYPFYALTGTILWQLFSDSLTMPLAALQQSKSILARLNFPRESVILSGLLGVMVTLLIRLILLGVMMMIFGMVPSAGILLFPVALFALSAAGLALGLMIAPAGMLFGDVGKLLTLILPVWMLLTPVVYPPRMHGLAATIAAWNPVTPLIETARASLTAQPLDHLPSFAFMMVLSFLLILGGWLGFRIGMPHLVARLG
mgnify:CR=1 FL=1